MLSRASLHAHESLRGTQISCSWISDWRSLLLRGYIDPPEVEDLTTAATPDHLIVLVTAGVCEIESYEGGRWRSASYCPGHLGMTSPGQTARLRWKSNKPHCNLQLHLPSGTIKTVAEELVGGASYSLMLPNLLSQTDPVIATIMLTLESAVQNGAPDLYAETAVHFLAVHLLTHHARMQEPRRDHWRGHYQLLNLGSQARATNIRGILGLQGRSRRHQPSPGQGATRS